MPDQRIPIRDVTILSATRDAAGTTEIVFDDGTFIKVPGGDDGVMDAVRRSLGNDIDQGVRMLQVYRLMELNTPIEQWRGRRAIVLQDKPLPPNLIG